MRPAIKRLLMQNNGSPLEVADTFTRADGAIGGDWTGTNWTISSNKAINTPTKGSELIVNGNFATDSDWQKGAGWTIAGGVAVATAVETNLLQDLGSPDNGFYASAYTVLNYSSGALVHNNVNARLTSTGDETVSADEAFVDEFRFWGLLGTGPATLQVDNVSIKPILVKDAIATQDFGLRNGSIQADITVSSDARHLAGLVLNADSASNTQNCVIVATNGDLYVFKVLAGDLVGVIYDPPVSIPYSAAETLKVVKHGNDYQVYYQDTLVTTFSITDIEIVNNTLHGLFSLAASSSFENFSGTFF